MTNNRDVYNALKVFLQDDLDKFAINSFNRRTKFKFNRRGEKYYVTVDLPPDVDWVKFSLYLKCYCGRFGWKCHLTSGGKNKWTFRMNSDLDFGW